MYWNLISIKKFCLIYSWFVYKAMLFFLYKVLVVGVNRLDIICGFEIEINVVMKNIYPVIFFLKKHTLTQFKVIVDIICYDNPKKKNRFSLIYSLLSINTNLRIKLVSKINEFDSILSLCSLFQSVNWYEREIHDFFGLFFILNNDLRRILTDYGFNGFPLRKDFSMSGYMDVYYNDCQKRICYNKIELTQEFRVYKLNQLWK